MELQRDPGTSTTFDQLQSQNSLQEIILKESSSIKFKQYHPYNHFNKGGNRTSGGVSIRVRKDIPQSQIHVDTDLQPIVVKATLHKPIHTCSIYIPLHDRSCGIKMNELLQQIPKPNLMLGDLNSYSTVWRCQKTDKKGKDKEKVIQNNNLCILDNKSLTYLNSFTGSYSVIDLTLCDPINYMDETDCISHSTNTK